MIDVLVVDDSSVIRDYLCYLLDSDPEIRVVGTAGDGNEAMAFLQRRKPDVITMDIHMPGADGFEVTRRIMETDPVPIVIVSASWDPKEVDKAFRALEAGAVAALEKPAGMGHPAEDRTVGEILQTVKSMSEVRVVKRWARTRRAEPAAAPPPEAGTVGRAGEVDVVAIGASTGGPIAVKTVLSGLRSGFPAPLLIVQHIAPGFLKGLADWLGQAAGLPVHIAEPGDSLMPGHAYLAADGVHMGVDRARRIATSRSEPENGLRPSVSHLFRSIAGEYGSSAVGVLLTGMGRDGAEELGLMRQRGAVTIAQDRETSVVYGMPGEAAQLGAASHVLPLERIAPALNELVGPAGDWPRPQQDGTTEIAEKE